MSNSATNSKRSAGIEWILRRTDVTAACLFLVTALIWSQTLPLFEAPDEHAHYRYAEFIAEHGRLPDANDIANLWEAFQPPLYYVLLAALFRTGVCEPGLKAIANPDFDGFRVNSSLNAFDAEAIRLLNSPDVVRDAYRLRLVNALFGAIFVFMCLKLVRAASAERVGLPMMALWVFVPAVVFSAATMSNDMLAALFCVAALLQYQSYRTTGRLRAIVLSGIFFGLGMMTKSTVLILWLCLLAVELLRAPRFQVNVKRIALFSIPLLIAGASVIRSLSMHPVMSPDPRRLEWMNQSTAWYLLSWILTLIKSIYWSVATSVGVLGSQILWLPGWIYGACFGLLIVFLFAAIRSLAQSERRFWSVDHDPEFIASALAAVLLLLLSVVRFRESGEPMHARLLFGYFPGLLLGVAAVAGRAPVESEGRVSRTRAVLALIGMAFAGLTTLLPNDAFFWAATLVKSTFMATSADAYYAAILRRGLAASALCASALILAPLLTRWLLPPVRRESGRILMFAGGGLIFNLGLLYMYVLPAFGS